MPSPKSPGRPPNPKPPPSSQPQPQPPPSSPPPPPSPPPNPLPTPGVSEPQPNPLRNPPPPELPRRPPGRPRKGETAAAPPPRAEGPEQPPPPVKRQLPADPTELDRALTPHRVEFESITELVDQLCSVLPPRLPLTAGERRALTDAGARVLYVHGGSIDPAWSLGLCLLAITVPRLVLYRRGVVDVGRAAREQPAA